MGASLHEPVPLVVGQGRDTAETGGSQNFAGQSAWLYQHSSGLVKDATSKNE